MNQILFTAANRAMQVTGIAIGIIIIEAILVSLSSYFLNEYTLYRYDKDQTKKANTYYKLYIISMILFYIAPMGTLLYLIILWINT